MNKKAGNKRPRPSYEEGELRDPTIAEKADPEYGKGDLLKLIRRAARQPSRQDKA